MTELFSRSRSLDSPAEIIRKKPTEIRRTRDRRGTIRASDFAKPKDGVNLDVTSFNSRSMPARRTRSGTIIGPPRKSTSMKSLAPAARTLRSKRTLDHTSMHFDREALQRLSDEDSEDELLLKDHWCDDNWIPLTGKVIPGRDSKTLSGASQSDDDLLLKAARDKCK